MLRGGPPLFKHSWWWAGNDRVILLCCSGGLCPHQHWSSAVPGLGSSFWPASQAPRIDQTNTANCERDQAHMRLGFTPLPAWFPSTELGFTLSTAWCGPQLNKHPYSSSFLLTATAKPPSPAETGLGGQETSQLGGRQVPEAQPALGVFM